jgi:hypothetical protein
MKQLLTLLCWVAVLTGTSAQTKKGSIVSFHILGAQNTELQALSRKDKATFDERIIKETSTYLKEEFALDTIFMGPEVNVKIKTDINRLSGVKRLSGKEKDAIAGGDLVFKIKCDIAFDQTTAGYIVGTPTSRAALYITIGVFDTQGNFLYQYKGKNKSDFVAIGKESVAIQTMSVTDFGQGYRQTLETLEKEE